MKLDNLTKAALATIILGTLLMIFVTHARGEGIPLIDRAKSLADLEMRHGEIPVSMGVDERGALWEMVANRKSGSWTLIITLPDGRTGFVTSGQGFVELSARPKGGLKH